MVFLIRFKLLQMYVKFIFPPGARAVGYIMAKKLLSIQVRFIVIIQAKFKNISPNKSIIIMNN